MMAVMMLIMMFNSITAYTLCCNMWVGEGGGSVNDDDDNDDDDNDGDEDDDDIDGYGNSMTIIMMYNSPAEHLSGARW